MRNLGLNWAIQSLGKIVGRYFVLLVMVIKYVDFVVNEMINPWLVLI